MASMEGSDHEGLKGQGVSPKISEKQNGTATMNNLTLLSLMPQA